MKKIALNLMLALFILMVATSCSKEVLLEEAPPSSVAPDSKLIVRTVADAGNVQDPSDESKVSYPVCIYVFDKKGVCCKTAEIEEGSTEVSLDLSEGDYSVYAVAGASADKYVLPAQGEAAPSSIVALNPDACHNDLMVASNVVSLVAGGENTLTLSLERKVMMINEIEISNVPQTVKSVSVTIAPLHENLCLDGSYSESVCSYSVALASGSDGSGVWKNAAPVYLLETASSKATITINMTDQTDKTTSYSYTSVDEMKANYVVNISGTYTAKSGVHLTGTIVGDTWEAVKNITFDFDESSLAGDDPGGGEPSQGIEGPAPELWSVYMDKYFVLKSEETGEGTAVTLMTLFEMVNVVSNEIVSDPDLVDEAIEKSIADLADGTDGITGWRLPNEEEVIYIRDYFGEIRKGLMAADYDMSFDEYYFFQTESGAVSSYMFTKSGEISDELTSGTVLRPVTTLVFK